MKLDLSRIHILAVSLVLGAVAIGPNVQAASPTTPPSNAGIRAQVEALFADAPQMVSIAQCESSFQQYTSNGATFTGAGGLYVGVFQLSKGHAASAQKLGFDIYTLEGNLGYARHLYDRSGVRPWIGCVKGATTVPTTTQPKTPTTAVLTKNLKMGITNSQVTTLQKILNDAGFFVAKSGPGSPDNETNYFGPATQAAVKKFQCEKRIVCEGTPTSTGYGYVGPLTRAALLKESEK